MVLHGLNPLVLHRDIKPSNLIWGEDEQVYLVDFGAVQDPAAVEGATFTVVGTAGYAPLEQFYGKAVPASDLYALGATLIHLLTGTAPADLPQSNLRIQFRDRISLNPSFLNWIECLTEPDLARRFSSATQALKALKTGHYLRYTEPTIRKPVGSSIRLKKSSRQLVIKITRRIAYEDFFKFGIQAIIAIGLRIFLLFPSLIVLAVVLVFDELNIIALGLFVFYTFPISILLIILLGYPWIRVLAALNKALLACFGHQNLYLDRQNLEIERQLFILRGKRRQICQTSDIKNVQSVTGEGVVVKVGLQRYVFSELTKSESDWLVKEIQRWLASIKN